MVLWSCARRKACAGQKLSPTSTSTALNFILDFFFINLRILNSVFYHIQLLLLTPPTSMVQTQLFSPNPSRSISAAHLLLDVPSQGSGVTEEVAS